MQSRGGSISSSIKCSLTLIIPALHFKQAGFFEIQAEASQIKLRVEREYFLYLTYVNTILFAKSSRVEAKSDK